MTKEQEQKLIEYTEYILQPINAKFISFDDPLVFYSSIRSIGDHTNIMSEENKITAYHMKFSIKNGDIVLSFMSDSLNDLKGAAFMSCTQSLYRKIVSDEDLKKINERIFDLYRQKNA